MALTCSLEQFFKLLLPHVDPILQLSVFIVTICLTLLGVSRNGASLIYTLLWYLVQLCLMKDREIKDLSARDQKILSDFPTDPRSFDNCLDLDPDTVIYAVCPDKSCQATHAPKFKDGSPIPIYPSQCKNRCSGKRCRTQLLCPRRISNTTIFLPIKPFVYFNPTNWLGRLLARHGLEVKMDAAWDRSKVPGVDPDLMFDIFDGEVLRNFKGPHGRTHFSEGNGEGRYVFSLSLDFFNPLGNKQAGKKISVGIISLVCLNLPPDIRYKPENMFLVGIIPGPNEPPLMSINFFLKPLVDDFLKLWEPGIYFSRTDGHRDGRLVRCAIVCVVCDLPAAKKTAGFAAHNHTHFCTYCHCTSNGPGYRNFNYTKWSYRSNEEVRCNAKEFNNAFNNPCTNSKADSIVSRTGVRWSQLLRLPYFKPTRFVVVDPMHNLLLSLLDAHFDTFLGIRLPKAEPLRLVFCTNFFDAWKAMSKQELASMQQIIGHLEKPMSADLATPDGFKRWVKLFGGKHLSVLELIADELECSPIPSDTRKSGRWTRSDYARGILQWVSYSLYFDYHVLISVYSAQHSLRSTQVPITTGLLTWRSGVF